MAVRKDYRSVAVMREGALLAGKRRGGVDHEYVVGFFVLSGGRVVLNAVWMGAAFEIDEFRMTTEAERFARWRTKQAAWQWLQRRPELVRTHRVVHLGRLDVLSTPLAVVG